MHHFLVQDERPAHVEEVEFGVLDPFLRSLVFTDGTVTRALEVQMLARVSVERVDQVEVPIPAGAAGHLEAERGEEAIRRRVRIGAGAELPILWAESYLIPNRLPPGFLGVLDGAADGIGQSLQGVALESCRELLWFGLDAPPGWVGGEAGSGQGTLRRLYRIVTGRRPAILISESFAVERRDGTYHLAEASGFATAGAEPLGAAR